MTWHSSESPSRYPLTAVTFVDASAGWAVGKRGTILRTTDGGATWAAQRSGVRRSLWSVVFADDRRGWATGAGGLLLTTPDGGLTWRRIRGRGGFFWDECGSLAVDGAGALWAAMGTQSMSGEFDRLLRSVDGGHHWRKVDLGWDYNVWDVDAQGTRIAAAGPADEGSGYGTSRVVLSDDGGRTWRTRVVGQQVTLAGVAVGAPQAVCAVGHGTFWSADGGETWRGAGLPVPAAGSFDFVGAHEGWVTGGGGFLALFDVLFSESDDSAGGSVLHTTDGATWREQLSEPGTTFTDVDFADANHGWVVGSGGEIRHTGDGGATWTRQDVTTPGLLFQVEAAGAEVAWVSGFSFSRNEGHPLLLHTVDGGGQWMEAPPPADFFPLVMRCLGPEDVWLAGVDAMGSALRHTVDGGDTWTVSAVPEEAARNLPLGMDWTDAQHGWVVSEPFESGQSFVLKTADGGKSWSRVGADVFTADHVVTSVDFVDADHGWTGGDRIMTTSDGGATWRPQVELPWAATVVAFDRTHAWAGADGAGILSTVDASGDTAPPVTLSEGERGWTRSGTRIALAADDGAGAGVTSTEYSVGGGAWLPYAGALDFPAPSDHSGDGAHGIRYRSTDASGLVESIQSCVVRVDTVRPVCRLLPSKVGRDNVLRLRGRIDDASAAYIDEFTVTLSRRGREVFHGGWSGFRWPTGKWRTFRHQRFVMPFEDRLTRGWYRVRLYAMDPAGNRQQFAGESRLLIKYRGGHTPSGGGSAQSARRFEAPGASAPTSSWLPPEVRRGFARLTGLLR